MSEFWAEFVNMWRALIEIEITRGIVFASLGILLSWPAYYLVLLLRKIPQDALPRERLPYLVAFLGLLLGCVLGAAGIIDQSHAIQVGIQAGAMTGLYQKK